MKYIAPYCLPSCAITGRSSLNVAKVQCKLRVASGLNLVWYGSMEWNMEENFSMEWNGRFLLWNEIKLPVWNMENHLPFHSIPCPVNMYINT